MQNSRNAEFSCQTDVVNLYIRLERITKRATKTLEKKIMKQEKTQERIGGRGKKVGTKGSYVGFSIGPNKYQVGLEVGMNDIYKHTQLFLLHKFKKIIKYN